MRNAKKVATINVLDMQTREVVTRPLSGGPKYPDVEVELTGKDGNAFAILGAVGNALRAAKVSQDEINDFYTEARRGDYDHLLRTTMSWVTVS